ncbi:hypothetical protein CFC21_037844 [Triticum aestivum]|uniref:F-box domain-containing protein n=3 Tax=Triticum TaxID=4564 RepID=A0A9R1JQ71_WHEAT|nr:putative F-box protein At3g52320 [Triticum aestivum]KAF7025685.1 hypothetical protein CFC21_037844 [Triticum aestivum]
MMRGSKKKKKKWDTGRSPVSELPDDLLVEIISRLIYKSTCCCQCVSTRWRDLISHPDHRKKLSQSTLAGFFFETWDTKKVSRRYQSVSGNWRPPINSSLSFLPRCEKLHILDCCNGLLLCKCWQDTDRKILDYVVCNPATEKWVVVPATNWSSKLYKAHLGFDPVVSSHFHVFEFVPTYVWDGDKSGDHSQRYIKVVGIYSSKAGVWTRQRAWDLPIETVHFIGSAFLTGILYLTSNNDLVATVDVDGNCSSVRVPKPHCPGCAYDVYVSRGHLYIANCDASEISIWVLEDFSTAKWTLKLNVSYELLFGTRYSSHDDHCCVISAHPEHNVIFIIVKYTLYWRSLVELFSYEMDSKELRLICDLGRESSFPYLSYVPLFSESLADEH